MNFYIDNRPITIAMIIAIIDAILYIVLSIIFHTTGDYNFLKIAYSIPSVTFLIWIECSKLLLLFAILKKVWLIGCGKRRYGTITDIIPVTPQNIEKNQYNKFLFTVKKHLSSKKFQCISGCCGVPSMKIGDKVVVDILRSNDSSIKEGLILGEDVDNKFFPYAFLFIALEYVGFKFLFFSIQCANYMAM